MRVLTEPADEARAQWPDRIISSRMVRRKKPQPVEGQKSMVLCTSSPTPSTEGLMMFLQVGLNCGMQFAFADVKNAFCQSHAKQGLTAPSSLSRVRDSSSLSSHRDPGSHPQSGRCSKRVAPHGHGLPHEPFVREGAMLVHPLLQRERMFGPSAD